MWSALTNFASWCLNQISHLLEGCLGAKTTRQAQKQRDEPKYHEAQPSGILMQIPRAKMSSGEIWHKYPEDQFQISQDLGDLKLVRGVYVKVYLTAVSWRPNIEKIPTERNFISIFLGNVFLVAQDM